MKTLRWGLLLAVGIVGGAVQVALAPSHPVSLVTVEIQDFEFRPATITVELGTAVSWVNHGTAPHTVTDVEGQFDSPLLQQSEQFQFTFDRPGSYDYFCRIHPFMRAKVIVRGEVPMGAAQFDQNRNGVIDDSELFAAVDQWVAAEISNELFFQVIDAWISQRRVT
jgi:plastocyanin